MAKRASKRRTSKAVARSGSGEHGPGAASGSAGATRPVIDGALEASVYAARRERVLRQLRGAVAVVFSGTGSPPLRGEWTPDLDFYYLTGIRHEAGAAVMFDPGNPDMRRRCCLFLRPLDPDLDPWDGYRERLGVELRELTGFQTVVRNTSLATLLSVAACRQKKAACLHGLSAHTAPVSPDLELFQKLAMRIPGLAIEDRSELLRGMRLVKSAAEQRLIGEAVRATEAGYRAVLEKLRPGMTERQVQSLLESAYVEAGSHRVAYNSIVAGAERACVLHYHYNDRELREGDLLLIDSGAEYGGYAADVTRVFPVSGRFTERQKEVYSVVLRAQKAAVKAVRSGTRMHEVDAVARQIIDEAGYGDTFIHGIGHHMGLNVHDPRSEEPLGPGAVVTVEPGVYLMDEAIGVRIEDDVLVTASGNRNLTRAIPKEIDEIEAAMAR